MAVKTVWKESRKPKILNVKKNTGFHCRWKALSYKHWNPRLYFPSKREPSLPKIKLAGVFPSRFLVLLFKGVVPRLSSSYCIIPIQSHSMGRPGGLDSPIILTGTFNLVSGHALHSAPWFNVFIRFDKAWKLFIHGFNKEKSSGYQTKCTS